MSDEEELEQEPEPEPASPSDWPGASPKQAAFLTALVFFAGHKTKAAKAAKVARSLVYRWLDNDSNFQLLFAQAQRQAFGVLEDEMLRRAHEGVNKGVYFQGMRCGHERVYSDGLMMMLARAGDPKYRSSVDVSGEVKVKHKFEGTLEDLLGIYRDFSKSPGGDD